MKDRVREQRVAEARAEIAKRIKRVCRDLPAAEFEKLLDRMTLLHCKYDIFPHLPELVDTAEFQQAIEEELPKFRPS